MATLNVLCGRTHSLPTPYVYTLTLVLVPEVGLAVQSHRTREEAMRQAAAEAHRGELVD